MWEGIEARIVENDRDAVVPLRRAFLAELVGSDLRPGTATKKMVAFDTTGGERLVWQVEAAAQNFYLHRKWSDRVEAAGFVAKLFPYQNGQKDGARHSGLSRDWSFGTSDCVQVRVDSVGRLKELIALSAVNYFVEPAREDRRSQVKIRVGDLHGLLGPSFTAAAVSDAISDPIFAETAGITRIGYSGAAQSDDETFTFAFEQTGKTEPMISTEIALPTNLILYGPPGTGKTYHTAFEAVRLCLGDQVAAAMLKDRKAVMEAYRALVSEGRVEFVTFHQSMSYEEFVEGLRPETGSSSGAEPSEGGAQSGGFALKVKDGLFKRIRDASCEPSRLSRASASARKSGFFLPAAKRRIAPKSSRRTMASSPLSGSSVTWSTRDRKVSAAWVWPSASL